MADIDRRADDAMFGFDFQINAAIFLMLEHIKELHCIRSEGKYEDIQIDFNDNNILLAQAKSVTKASTDFKNVRRNLEKSIETLNDGYKKSKKENKNINKLIFITNSSNPFNNDYSKAIFQGLPSYRNYDDLPNELQQIIDKYMEECNADFDKSLLMIQTLPFETDIEQEKYKFVKQAIDEFIFCLGVNNGVSKRLMGFWQNEIFKNSTKKDDKIVIKKEDIIWPIIVLIIDTPIAEDKFYDIVENDLYEEVVNKYRNIIDSCSNRYQFVIKVLYDYNSYKSYDLKSKNKNFINECWRNYLDEFVPVNCTDEIKESLIKIILFKIINNRSIINDIKKKVNL